MPASGSSAAPSPSETPNKEDLYATRGKTRANTSAEALKAMFPGNVPGHVPAYMTPGVVTNGNSFMERPRTDAEEYILASLEGVIARLDGIDARADQDRARMEQDRERMDRMETRMNEALALISADLDVLGERVWTQGLESPRANEEQATSAKTTPVLQARTQEAKTAKPEPSSAVSHFALA
ncbi:hypothetical protein T484DRAFT_1874871 [Baffinella frigidus]|nr:hypothetical protein T484DRAFT_1874871 [Cryptophyta sp. CCMP2293]